MGGALGLPQSTTKRWLHRLRSEGETVSHNVGRPRCEEAGLCRFFCSQPTLFSAHLSRNVRDLCICSVGPMINQARDLAKILIAGIIADTPCCAVTRVRKRLQTSGMERGRTSAHEGGALASEACDLWESCGFSSLHILMLWPSTGEASAPDGVEQAVPPGVVHIDVAAAWRSKRAHSGTSHARHTFLPVSGPFFSPLCKRSFTPVSRFCEELSPLRCGACSFVSRCSLLV